MIHVGYGLYDRDGHYSKFCGTSIVSIFENTSEQVTVHILHDNTLTAENRDKFVYLVGQYRQRIKFYNVETLAADRIDYIKRNSPELVGSLFSIGTLYRFLLPELIPVDVDKIIYLDCGDTALNLDIKELWKVDVSNYPLAAVPELFIFYEKQPRIPTYIGDFLSDNDYFNAGVIIFNL